MATKPTQGMANRSVPPSCTSAQRILITGSEGLVGTALRAALETRGASVVGLDLRGAGGERGDVCDAERVVQAVAGCEGVIHLAAVSRVVWGERDPEECWRVNVGGLRNVIEAVERQSHRPWLVFASSREVYGQPDELPASEDAHLRPVNVYGRSKVQCERLMEAGRARGLRGAVVRLSNVYGSTRDHADRVVPAFARAAVLGDTLRVDGSGQIFDFTHVEDTTRGLMALVRLVARNGVPPPIHLLTGQPVDLGHLAALAREFAGNAASIIEAPARRFDVARFYGNPARAQRLLGWSSRIPIREGIRQLVRAFQVELANGGMKRHAL